MKISLIHTKDGDVIEMDYGKTGFAKFAKIYEDIGLNKRASQKILGDNLGTFYRLDDGEQSPFMESFARYMSRDEFGELFYDDVNSPVMYRGRVNIAIFRVVPDSSGKLRFKLNQFITRTEFLQIAEVAKKVYSYTLNEIRNMTVELNFVSKNTAENSSE
jgi:hypothetical protein